MEVHRLLIKSICSTRSLSDEVRIFQFKAVFSLLSLWGSSYSEFLKYKTVKRSAGLWSKLRNEQSIRLLKNCTNGSEKLVSKDETVIHLNPSIWNRDESTAGSNEDAKRGQTSFWLYEMLAFKQPGSVDFSVWITNISDWGTDQNPPLKSRWNNKNLVLTLLDHIHNHVVPVFNNKLKILEINVFFNQLDCCFNVESQ